MPLSTNAIFISHVGLLPHDDKDHESNYEPAGSEPIRTGNISKCASFSRTFVKNKCVMGWIDKGYDMVWVTSPPIAIFPQHPAPLTEKCILNMIEVGFCKKNRIQRQDQYKKTKSYPPSLWLSIINGGSAACRNPNRPRMHCPLQDP